MVLSVPAWSNECLFMRAKLSKAELLEGKAWCFVYNKCVKQTKNSWLKTGNPLSSQFSLPFSGEQKYYKQFPFSKVTNVYISMQAQKTYDYRQ